MMFCPNCGSKMEDGAAFCGACGSALTPDVAGETFSQAACIKNSAASSLAAVNDPFAPSNYVAVKVDPAQGNFADSQSNSTNAQGQAYSSYEIVPNVTVTSPTVASVPAQAAQHKGVNNTVLIVSIITAGVLVLALGIFLLWKFVLSPQQTSSSVTYKTPSSTYNLTLSQVDNSAFPKVTIYARITDSSGNDYEDVSNLNFSIQEFDNNNNTYTGSIETVAKLVAGDAMNINLVMDESGSMSSSNKLTNARTAANAFIDEMNTSAGTSAEVTGFSDNVFSMQPFTQDKTLLHSAVNSTRTMGQTALNDALYWAIQRTNSKSGSRVVIAFTDGEENASHYKESDVKDLSKRTGIPVYLVGVGSSVNSSSLKSLAEACNGSYFSVGTSSLSTELKDIYSKIYANQNAMCKIVYTSSYENDKTSYRSVNVCMKEGDTELAQTKTQYMPEDGVTLDPTQGNNVSYIVPECNSRYLSESDLQNLSLWELYLARNEIYARHGRGFKNKDLQEYFGSRSWYHQEYTAEQFERLNPYPLNDYELKNAVLMRQIEESRNSPYLKSAE